MIKKRLKRTKYLSDNKTFTTFKEMKTYAYFNTETGGTKEGYELADDEIIENILTRNRIIKPTKSAETSETDPPISQS